MVLTCLWIVTSEKGPPRAGADMLILCLYSMCGGGQGRGTASRGFAKPSQPYKLESAFLLTDTNGILWDRLEFAYRAKPG